MSDNNNSVSLVIGGEVKTVGMGVGGKLFVFTPNQMQFLLALQKMKSVAAATISVGKDEEWGQKFLKSRKFREYISCKMEEFSVKNGLTVEWFYQFGKWVAEGFRESYKINCNYCDFKGTMTSYEAETYRTDEMVLEIPCPACCKTAAHIYEKEKFEPSREQVVAWQELGSRLIPKIERIHHQFSKEEIIFQSESEGG